MRPTTLFVLLMFPCIAAAQLEIAADALPAQPQAPEAPGFEPSFAVHSGLRFGYTNLSSSSGGIDHAIVGGPMFGILFSHEAWRIFDMRMHLLQFGAGWGQDSPEDLTGDIGLTLGTGLRTRIEGISLAITALAGFSGWLSSPNTFTAELGGEASITLHFGCEAAEIGYQVMATASDHGFAEGPSQRVVLRFVGQSDGPDREACRDR